MNKDSYKYERKKKNRKQKKFEIPAQEEVRAYLMGVESGEIDSEVEPGNFFSGRKDRLYRGERVRLVTKQGKFLGFGQLGDHDWFVLTNDRDGTEIQRKDLHHEHASESFWMTTLSSSKGLPLFGDIKRVYKKLKP